MLLVVAIIAVLAGIVVVAINPGKQLATVRNTERSFNLNEIHKAMQQYFIDHYIYPAATPTTLTEICNTGSNSTSTGIDCTGLIDLSPLVPTYLTSIPVDPQGSTLSFINNFIPKVYATTNGTGYKVMKDTNNKIVLTAPQAELNAFIAIGTSTAATTTASTLGDGLVAHWKMNDNLATTNVLDNKGSNNGTSVRNTSLLSTTTVSSGMGGTHGALGFNGSSDEIVAGNETSTRGTTALTVTAWVKINAWQYSNTYKDAGIISTRNAGLAGWQIVLDGGYPSTGHRYFSWGVQTVNGWFSPTSVTDYNTGQWYFLTATYNGAYVVLYVNGNQNSSKVATGNLISNDAPVWIGNYYDKTNRYMNGSIDDVRIYNRVLTPTEISELYNGGVGTEGE